MEITVDGMRVLTTVVPFGLLIIAIHTRNLRRRIRVVPKTFALWATVVVITASIVSLGACFAYSNAAESMTGFIAWFVVVSSAALGLQTAATFYEYVVISMEEEEEP